jgi:hypothetical protein
MTPTEFVEAVAALRFPGVFNPYSDFCPHFDLPDAAAKRRQNLRSQVRAAVDTGGASIWIGRDLGFRGGRRTGIALTDEPHLNAVSTSFGQELALARATVGPAVSERTATVVWRAIGRLNVPVFTWNVFPLHPHEEGKPLSNRCHTKAERHCTRAILLELLNMLRPQRVVAIGNDGEAGLLDLGILCDKVRHPSYGGVADFERGISMLHGITYQRTHQMPEAMLL